MSHAPPGNLVHARTAACGEACLDLVSGAAGVVSNNYTDAATKATVRMVRSTVVGLAQELEDSSIAGPVSVLATSALQARGPGQARRLNMQIYAMMLQHCESLCAVELMDRQQETTDGAAQPARPPAVVAFVYLLSVLQLTPAVWSQAAPWHSHSNH